jgi:hypothetical protein
MGVEGQQFADARDGLMRLYGADVARDRRYLVAFVRDVSAVPEEEYQDLAAPSKVGSFPGDLRDQDLEYSGIYEDGWVSEMSFFMLAQPEGPSRVAVRGVVPMIDDPAFQCELSVLLDGRELTHQKLLPGRFDVEAPVSADKASRRRVELRFSGVQQLPPPDGRPAAARLDFVGFD